jgi:hypothetical protein
VVIGEVGRQRARPCGLVGRKQKRIPHAVGGDADRIRDDNVLATQSGPIVPPPTGSTDGSGRANGNGRPRAELFAHQHTEHEDVRDQ